MRPTRGCSAPLTHASNGRNLPPSSRASSPNKQREVAERVMDHVGPGSVAARQIRPSRPAQRGQHRRWQSLQRQALVDAIARQRGRRRFRRLVRAQHRAQNGIRSIGGQPLQAGPPGIKVQILESRRKDSRPGRSPSSRSPCRRGRRGCHHGFVRLGAHLQRCHESMRQRFVLCVSPRRWWNSRQA